MRTVHFFLSLVLSASSSASDFTTNPIEVFPLRVGLHYTCDFNRSAFNRDLAFVETTSDSGRVEYHVNDSVFVNDTTTHWSLQQERSLVHRYHNSVGVDSLYPIVDSATVLLTEFTNGFHELRCSSFVWSFPLIHSGSETSTVYRYSDSLNVIASWLLTPPRTCGANYDSAWYSSGLGFHRRKTEGCFSGGITSGGGSTVIELSSPPVSVREKPLPELYPELSQNYPNPFNSDTKMQYRLWRKERVTLKIFDLLGREVTTLIDRTEAPGEHSATFDAGHLSSGVYLYRIISSHSVQTNKMLLLR